MGLTGEERSLLERLTKKADEPDEPPMGKSVSFNLDLGDPEQIARAIKLGLLSPFEDKEEEGKKKETEGDDTPRRKGYFKEKD